MSTQENLPATPKQRQKIARFSQLLDIEAPIETGIMTMAQAGMQIRHLSDQLKLRRLRRGRKLL